MRFPAETRSEAQRTHLGEGPAFQPSQAGPCVPAFLKALHEAWFRLGRRGFQDGQRRGILSRRDDLLKIVDAKIAALGEDKVLCF